TYASLVLQTEIGEAAEAFVRGGVPRVRDAQHLLHLGLDETALRAIGQETWERGSFVRVADTEKWSSRPNIEAFRLALRKGINEAIVTPGKGDIPRFLRTETGKMMGQY